MPEVICWNPRQRLGTGPISRRISSFRRIRNFGDLLGPVIVDRIHRRLALGDGRSASQRLLTVGSVLREARVGDVVWGSGVNGKSMLMKCMSAGACWGPSERSLLLSSIAYSSCTQPGFVFATDLSC